MVFNLLSTIFYKMFYGWNKPEYTEETTNLSQITDKMNE